MWEIRTFSTRESLSQFLNDLGQDKCIGVVPTMGALHPGHISLVERAEEDCDIVVVSIFVNPKQFNNPTDLERYPRTLEADLDMLKGHNVVVYNPSVDDVYGSDHVDIDLELGSMGEVMEGKYRPGHFDGVVNVIYRLFEIVKPQNAYFGLKDFQQVAVVQFLTNTMNLPVEIVACPTHRERNGLAMSSRNKLLSEKGKNEASVIFKALTFAKESAANGISMNTIKADVKRMFDDSSLTLEYFEIVDPSTLKSLDDLSGKAQACVAAFCEDVRLIDNLELK